MQVGLAEYFAMEMGAIFGGLGLLGILVLGRLYEDRDRFNSYMF